MQLRIVLLVIALFAGMAFANDNSVEDWDEWRGPRRDGSFVGAKWPGSLAGLTEKWSVSTLGKSYSGPIVVGDRIFAAKALS